MSQNRRRNNPQDMTIYEQLEKIKEEMCDRYCKYRDRFRNDADSNLSILNQEQMDCLCNCCPLTRL